MDTTAFARIRATWPTPPVTPTDALLHAVDLHVDQPDDELAVLATSNFYGPGTRTGLTWGDLRAIANLINQASSAV